MKNKNKIKKLGREESLNREKRQYFALVSMLQKLKNKKKNNQVTEKVIEDKMMDDN